jgi:hypothetical protein
MVARDVVLIGLVVKRDGQAPDIGRQEGGAGVDPDVILVWLLQGALQKLGCGAVTLGE